MPSVLDNDLPEQPILSSGPAAKPFVPPPTGVMAPAGVAAPVLPMRQPDPPMRGFADIDKTRQAIYDGVLEAARGLPEFSNNKYKLRLADVNYVDSDKPTIAERKKAILRSETLDRRLQGTWQLTDHGGNLIDERKMTMARIPKLTNGGTFVLNGVEYTLANQARLRPGIFTRQKQNGEIESHVNVMPGKGVSHRYTLDPEKGTFKLTLGQANLPLFPILKAFGATDSQIRGVWGNELFVQNAKQNDPQAVDKLAQRLLKKSDMTLESEGRLNRLREVFNNMELDDTVTSRTLGKPYKNLSVDAILDSTRKILSVQRRESEADDRDAMAYQMVYGPEDFFAEKMRSAYKVMNPLLWKSTFKNNLSPLASNFLGKHMNSAILNSGLGQPSEEVNNAEILGQLTRMSRLGEGGIPSLDAVPDEARSVQPSHFGYVDPLLTPESLKVGVDSRLAMASQKGKDGKIYTKFLNVKTGEPEWRTPQDVADSVIAFPKEMDNPNAKTVAALVSGKIKYVPRESVELTLPHMEDSFNPLVNMIPLKSTIKGQRVMMGARMLTQALPLRNAEAPLVQSGVPGDADESFEERYGKYMGAIRSDVEGQVVKVTPDEIHIKGPDGKIQSHELHNNLPYNRKTYLHNTPTVKVGDMVDKDSLLAKSNFTNDKGATALGLNMRTAYIPYKGYNFEDATVISESAAKRLSSEHMYQHDVEFDDKTKVNKKHFISMYPSTFDRQILDSLDDDGVIKPGTVVNSGAPIILQVQEKERAHNQITRGRTSLHSDSSVLWEHHDPGVVTDVEKTKKGIVVTVKSYAQMQVGDKLCYDPATEVLTSEGWKPVYEIGFGDLVASLNPDTNEIEYVNPAEVHVYHHKGRMYSLNTTQVNLLVTDNHNLYAKTRNSEKYDLYEAKDLFGKRYKLKKNGTWKGSSPDFVELGSLAVKAGQSGNGERELEPILVPAKTYAMLLGMYLSEGNLFNQPKYGSYGFDICQIKSAHTAVMLKALDEAGVKYNYNETNGKVRIYSKQWLRHLSDFGSYSYNKGIPSFVFDWGTDLLQVLFDWLMWGDGHVGKTHSVYTTTSKKLAGDFQRLCLHLGISANVKTTAESAGTIKGKAYKFRERYDVFVYKKKNHPEINHSGASSQSGQTEEWVDYVGQVFCVTLSKNHIMYVRRKGKTLWCGNSGRYGDKGVIADIVPDDKMPKDSEGRPFEVLVNPLGIITRCYDEQTEFLTQRGWLYGKDVQPEDKILSYHTGYGYSFWADQLSAMHSTDYQGRMIGHKNKVTDFLVTPNHSMWVKSDFKGSTWGEKTADDIFGKRYVLPAAASAIPDLHSPVFILPGVERNGVKDTSDNYKELRLNARDWAEFLGWFLAEGNVTYDEVNSEYRTHIAQSDVVKPFNCKRISELLNRLPFRWNYGKKNKQFHLSSKQLASYLRQFGKSQDKFIPDWLFRQEDTVRKAFIDGYWAGDGSIRKNKQGSVVSTASSVSKLLVEDLHRLLTVNGETASIHDKKEKEGCKQAWTISRSNKKTRTTRHDSWYEITDYYGKIYCPNVSSGYVFTRRNGKVIIAGNTNPGQMVEAVLGKIAEKTGKRYAVKDFDKIKDMTEFAKEELRKHGLSDTEDIEDPEIEQKIKGVFTGNRFFMKLHHMAESKGSGRSLGSYTAEESPARGGQTGSKRVSLADNNALLSHGALEVLTDAGAIRGQKNQDYWAAFMSGRTPPEPRIPFVYNKFFEQLRSAGINPVRNGPRVQIMALTGKDIDSLAEGREIQSAETVDWKEGLKPIKGGLFDTTLTGGHNGNRWSYIKLHEPMPSPVMEEPIRRVLGLTQQKFMDVLGGKEKIGEESGPEAIGNALKRINLPEAVKRAETEWRGSKRSTKDAALKRWALLKHTEKLGLHPSEWMLDKIPVLPPAFRPVSVMGASGKPLVSDPNYLYKEAFDANQALKETSSFSRELADERTSLYKAFKGVTGLGDPVTPKNQESNVKGVLKYIFGDNPKFSVMQRKLLSTTVDVVGRGVISPNPNLDMDQVGLPESKAWEIYRPFIIRRLARRGIPALRAAEMVEKQDKIAKDAMQQELDDRPVIITRAPVLHRYGVMAFRPQLIKSETLQISPAIVKGFGADFDGDTMNYHVPVSEGAVKDALEKMLPSKNLLSTKTFRAHQLPQNEYQGGLYHATAFVSNKPERYFATKADAIKAYKSGEIGSDQKVVILN